jgi:RNA polymerase sigma factor (sigma-70 family)
LTTTAHIDQYLIDGLVQNDSSIINGIYKKYSGKILKWVQQNNGTHAEAEDVFQEAIIDIYRKAINQGFELSCPFDAFLFVVVRNKWFAYLKSNKNKGVTITDKLESSIVEEDANKIMQYENQYQLLVDELNELHDGCKDLLKLSWGGLDMATVAEKLNVTYAYVRKKKSLCMAKLIENIKNNNKYNELTFLR